MTQEQTQHYFNTILSNYRGKRAFAFILYKGIHIFFANLVYTLLLYTLESYLYFSPSAKYILLSPLLLNVYVFWGVYLYFRMKNIHDAYLDNHQILLNIGKSVKGEDDTLLNIYQISKTQSELAEYACDTFIATHPLEGFVGLEFPQVSSKIKLYSSLMFLLFILLVFISPAPLLRLVSAQKTFFPHHSYNWQIQPESGSFFPGDTVSFSIEHSFPESYKVDFHLLRKAGVVLIPVRLDSSGYFDYQIPSVRDTLRYYLSFSKPNILTPFLDFASDTFILTPKEIPEIRRLTISVFPPEYTGLEPGYYSGNVDKISAIEYSKIRLDIDFSQTMAEGKLLFEDKSLDFNIHKQSAHLDFILRRSGEYSLQFQNIRGISLSDNLSYGFQVIPDEYPNIQVLIPAGNIKLNEQFLINYELIVSDDIGIKDIALLYRLEKSFYSEQDSSWFEREIPHYDSLREQVLVSWEIEEFLSPGDKVIYKFRVRDTDEPHHYKVTESEEFTALFPSLMELFNESHANEDEIGETMTETLEELQELLETTKDIKEDLLKEGELNWENKQELESYTEKQKNIQENLEQIKEAIQEQIDMLSENKLFSDDVLDNFEKLQSIFDELMESELFRKIQELQQKLESGSPESLAETLEEFENTQQQFNEALERALDIFEEILKEERLEEILAKIEDMLEEQEKILNSDESKSNSELAGNESKAEDKFEQFQDDIQNQNTDNDTDYSDVFQELKEQMQQSNPGGDMQKSSEEFKNNRRDKAMKSAGKAKEKLKSMQLDFLQNKKDYQEKKKNDILRKFRQIYFKTIQCSFEQEELNKNSIKVNKNSPRLGSISSAQFQIQIKLQDIHGDLYELSKKTFFVNRELGAALGTAGAYVQSVIKLMEDGNTNSLKKPMNEALGALNTLAYQLLNQMDAVSAGEGGSGLEEYLQQLQDMAGQQQSINGQTSQLSLMGNKSGSKMQKMAELAAMQQALRKSLSQLANEMKMSGNDPLGDLGRVKKDMEEVINDLRRNKADRRTIQRQQKILQRMLDASRSVRKRDKSEERESESGQNISREGILKLPDDLGNKDSFIEQLRREIRSSDLSMEEKMEMERYIEKLEENF